VPNPLINELLSVLNPESSEVIDVVFRNTTFSFRPVIPNKLQNWASGKVPISSMGTLAQISMAQLPQIVASLVAINGKDIKVYVADHLKEAMKPYEDGAKERQDITDYDKKSTLETLADQTARDYLLDILDDSLDPDTVSDLYSLYLEHVKKPSAKRRADFFGSLWGTSATPSGPKTI
jgi:hypothetical protein